MSNQHKNAGINKKIFIFVFLQGLHSVSVGQTWTFPKNIEALVGSCVVIPCSFTGAKGSSSSRVIWFVYDKKYYIEIYNSEETSGIHKDYRGRTSRANTVPDSCSLRINNVRWGDADTYYPGIDTKRNSFYQEGTMTLNTRANPHQPVIRWSGTLNEGQHITVTCSVEHTCVSNPPRLQWNKPGEKSREYQTDFVNDAWQSVTELIYTPTYTDHGAEIQCTAIHHNGKTSHSTKNLDIDFSPKNVTVLISEHADVQEGTDVTLKCNSVSNPHPTSYEWYKGKERIKMSAEVQQDIQVRNVTFQNEIYSCSAENHLGKAESPPKEIEVQYVAKNVKIVTHRRNGNSELTCNFSSSRPPVTSYSWLKDGSPMLNRTEKTITMSNEEFASGEYQCVANNKAGNSMPSEIIKQTIEPEAEFDLPLILGSMAGVIVVLIFVLILYIYIRQKREKEVSEVHGTIPFRFPVSHTSNQDNEAARDNLYDNIDQMSDTTKLHSSKKPTGHFTGDNHNAVYTNTMMENDWNQEGIEYAVIHHSRHNTQTQHRTTLNIGLTEDLEYAVVKN